MADVFKGSTINTPSMLAVEDQLDALAWAEKIGGLDMLIARSQKNLEVISTWVDSSNWAAFLAKDESQRSSTSICITNRDKWFTDQTVDEQNAVIKAMVKLLADDDVAYDIGGYRDAPPGLRIWGGGTVESSDTEKLLPWLDWSFDAVKK